MTSFRCFASLVSGLLLATQVIHAQTPLGQPTLDEQKAQIWCATARFVYDDNKRPNLKNSLKCTGSLKEFENSIKADSQKVYSALYSPLEKKGAMYKGLGSDKSRLQKLANEIVGKLKASAARRKDPKRMQALDALDASLKNYVANGTPPGDVSSSLSAEAPTDTTAAADEATASAGASVGPAPGTDSVSSPARATTGESTMSKLFAPIALILSLLSLFLYVLLRRSLSALGTRADRHRNELESVKAASNAAPAAAWAGPTLKTLTPELKQEIERLVQQQVAEQVSRNQPVVNNPKMAAIPKPVPPQPKPETIAKPDATAAPAPKPAPAAPAAADVSKHTQSYSEPASLSEAEPLPVVMPAGPPAAALRDEFDSLVPPVQLPATNSWSAATQPLPQAGAPEQPMATRYYVKVPVNGGFSEYDLQEQPQHDSIYEITLNPQRPEMATFRVNPNPQVHAYAIQSAQYSLRDACRYQLPSTPVSRIVTDEEGTLRKASGAWQIEQKAAIHFE